MPAFQFESNLSIILLIIVIVLICLYFYLDMKKVKLITEDLEKKNEMIIKEIDNIHLQMHKFFSRMPQSIVPQKGNPKMSGQNNTKITQNVPETMGLEQSNIEQSNVEQEQEQEQEQLEETEPLSGILGNNSNQTKLQSSNNILGEVEEMISNNIFQDNKNLDLNPPLIPVTYDSNIENKLDPENKLEPDSYGEEDEDDEVDDVNLDEDNSVSSDGNISEDDDEDKFNEYMKMSIKNLKAKCIEMNLQHSGNKSTLAKRIVENL